MQLQSWTSSFMTTCNQLHVYRGLEVMILSTWNCVQSCSHSQSFLALDHVKDFMIVSASKSWSCLHKKFDRQKHALSSNVIITVLEWMVIIYHTNCTILNDKFIVYVWYHTIILKTFMTWYKHTFHKNIMWAWWTKYLSFHANMAKYFKHLFGMNNKTKPSMWYYT